VKIIQIALFLIIGTSSFSQEICDNGIDDDLDGLIDLQDTTDCTCQFLSIDSSASAILPNPSFEQRSCCPNAASQLSCVNDWIQATGATPDYLNTCNLTSVGTFPVPPTPLPDGVGYIGFFDDYFPSANSIIYKEYIGACLNDTMKIGKNYQLDFYLANSFGSLTTELAIFGTTDCANLPFGSLLNTPTSLCPTTVAPADWTLLDIDTVTCSSSSWVKGTINFMPTQNYTAIVIGPSCNNNATGANYYYLDNLILSEESLFSPRVSLIVTGNYCQGNLKVKADFDTIPQFFQWYKDSVAIAGATDSVYSVPNGGLGSYQLLATYDSICVMTDVIRVDTTLIIFDVSSTGTCSNTAPSGELMISNVRGGTPPYFYQLNNGPFLNDSIFNGLSPGSYTLTVRDSNGCESVVNSTVNDFPIPKAKFANDSVCLGVVSSFSDESTIATGSLTNWEWSLPGNPSSPLTNTTFPNSGSFPVTLIVTSDLGCKDSTTRNSLVYPLPNANFTFTPQELYTFDTEVCFINQSIGAVFYNWNFDFMGVNGTSTLENPCKIKFPANQEEDYQVQLKAETAFGCLDSVTVTVSIFDEFLIYIPSGFSPNKDGLNDELVISIAGVEQFAFQVFNRWGELVFNTNDMSDYWDGTHNGIASEMGTYVYRAVITGENGVTKEIFGHVNLVK